ncbi:hypothetical protein SAMN05892883_4175 [Jatrophihabitans sp. GAS493]|uniref:hypothetical protein n=1 Tax=Jatrophihabitans sp. GAS493 TaxID=1907575 RepID=UPI000BB808BB|nr:hypothetical protein [Jatrophihabitans sp. GAS493]SOD74978.1 hypothetical protein SAMN05892883_4175 [Jatrophihabitans sp. GAS493]
MTTSANNLPAGQIVKFDKASYLKLIAFVDGVNNDADTRFLRATAGMSLDDTLSSRLHPGSPAWDQASRVLTASDIFGTSVNTQIGTWVSNGRAWVNALNKATDVFENTDDLAAYSADTFVSAYPGVGTSSGSPSALAGTSGGTSGGTTGNAGTSGKGGTTGNAGTSGKGGTTGGTTGNAGTHPG